MSTTVSDSEAAATPKLTEPPKSPIPSPKEVPAPETLVTEMEVDQDQTDVPETRGSDSELSELKTNIQLSPDVATPQDHDNEIIVGDADADADDTTILIPDDSVTEEAPTDALPTPAAEASPSGDPASSHYPKRKRTSTYDVLAESKIEAESRTPLSKSRALVTSGIVKTVVGTWRDSPAPDHIGKHAVIAFIDAKDRLRTRVQANNIEGTFISGAYPLRAGAGGTWVTFDRVIFQDHLVGHFHHTIKEFIRIRAKMPGAETSDLDGEKEALRLAIAKIEANPTLTTEAGALQVAKGAEDDSDLAMAPPAEKKRKFTPLNMVPIGTPPTGLSGSTVIDTLPGTRPTRVLIGYWRDSDAEDPKDAHAVLGVLAHNGNFRIKLTQQTRDGREVKGNFPSALGAMWISFEKNEVILEPHLTELDKVQLKEYCRVRQWQMDTGETADQISANEKKAVKQARDRVSSGAHKVGTIDTSVPIATRNMATTSAFNSPTNGTRTRSGAEEEPRSMRRQPLPGNPQTRASTRPSTRDQGRIEAFAQGEIARAEATQNRADLSATNRERAVSAAAAQVQQAGAEALASSPAAMAQRNMRFHETADVQRMNEVWSRQEQLRSQPDSDEVKFHAGLKYERKRGGAFAGKLVSQGNIISIDGEDYVEYRILTKPSFF